MFFNEHLENDVSKRLQTHGIIRFSKEYKAKLKAWNFMFSGPCRQSTIMKFHDLRNFQFYL